MKEIKLQDSYNNQLHTYIFDEVDKPQGVVQILHGMNEYGLRYIEFAEYLNESGYIVYITDHVSQGLSRTEKDKNVVYFGKKGHEILVDGLITTKNQIQKDYPNLDMFLFGHSLGSMIIRKYLIDHKNEYKKIVINGGGLAPLQGIGMGIVLGSFLKIFKKKKPSDMFDEMFRQTQFKLKEKVEIDHFIEWLTRDKEKTQANKEDDFLFIRLSVGVFTDLLKLVKEINTLKNIEQMNLDVPIMILSGTHDAATDFGEAVIKLHDKLTEYGFNSTYKLYEEGRHDTLQEINRTDVFKDIVTWIGE